MYNSNQMINSKEDAIKAVMSPFADAMGKIGINESYLAKKLKKELTAKETKFFQKDGEVIETRDVVAWDVRQRARIDSHKLFGHYPAEKVEHDISGSLMAAVSAYLSGQGNDRPAKQD